ncbi:putative efflux protein, MATE family [Xenococcus sp. PCC 7305]|uniref:MATE family efflux transporter n=1 Tax=Xenococcus sp. PCC 7305 TaxID=102125 RepID=UPI0002AC74B4|nr:MATE family efflux transporter [Xenococcus sp. PCC 7305]ELS02620.1 putative efflux protein, MATE family [Xenococcus sp. PCC 7305]
MDLESTVFESKLLLEARAYLKLAVPYTITQLSEAIITFVDTVMIGLLGSEALAAAALGVVNFFTLLFLSKGVLETVSVFAAEAFGAEKPEQVKRITSQGIWLGFAIAVPMMLIVWHLDVVLLLIGQDESLVLLAKPYLQAVVWSFPAAMGFVVLEEVGAAIGRPQWMTGIVVAGGVLNGVADYLLLFGKFGLPALGLAGIGWATTLGYWFCFIAAAGLFLFHPNFRKYNFFPSLNQFDKALLVEILKTGWPLGLQYGIEMGMFSVTALLMGYFGSALLAAHEITITTLELSITVPLGFSYATAIRVGQLIGQKDFRGVKRSGFVSVSLGIMASLLISLVFWLFPDQIAALYLDINNPSNIEEIDAAISLIRIAGIFQLVFGIQMITMGALVGLKDTLIPTLITVVCYWAVGLGGGYLIGFTLEQEGVGLWWGLTLGMTLAAVMLVWRFFRLISAAIDEHEAQELQLKDKRLVA